MSSAIVPDRDTTFYIESDGQPMGESPWHIRNLRYSAEPLETWYADDPNVFIGVNMFLHYVRGDANRHVSPDLFVVKGVPKITRPERGSYRVWQEKGRTPNTVIEYTSPSTAREDLVTKKRLYRVVLKVQEYFLFDPHDEYLRPRLQGFRRVGNRFNRIREGNGRLPSEELNLHLFGDGELLRFYDPVANRVLPIPPEIAAEAEAEAEGRRRAEAEVQRLRRELDELRRRLPPS